MRRLATFLGSLASLTLIFWILYHNLGDVPDIDITRPRFWYEITTAFALYAGSQLLGAFAWRNTLWAFGANTPAFLAESQLLVSQVGKYLPGSIGQYIGRFALAHFDGVSSSVISVSLFVETMVTVGVGLLVAVGLWLLMPDFTAGLAQTLPGRGAFYLTIALVPVVLAVCALMVNALRPAWLLSMKGLRFRMSFVMISALIHALNFFLLGVSLYFVAKSALPGSSASLGTCVIVFVIAWVAGFLTPGAPGGVGIRDSIITLGLSFSIGTPAALAAALLHRAVSVCGDVAIFGVGLVLRRTLKA